MLEFFENSLSGYFIAFAIFWFLIATPFAFAAIGAAIEKKADAIEKLAKAVSRIANVIEKDDE